MHITTETTAVAKKEKLYFLQDVSFPSGSRQVYSGHGGTGRRFSITVSDYGKYAMYPRSHKKCIELKRQIEIDAKGRKGLGKTKFQWKIIPITDISLCNFWTTEEHHAFDALQEEQKKLFKK